VDNLGGGSAGMGRLPGMDLSTAPTVPGYELGPLLGAGGTGRVWAATRSSDGHPVAVKVVPVGTGGQADVAARELAVLARARVEGLVGFHESLGLDTDPPAVAVVLDRVGGGSLERVVQGRGHLSVGEAVTVLSAVAHALAGLHALGVTHGDVTPANVLVERTGRPLLADLGVASIAGEPPGEVYGTQGFVAPEVLDRGEVGAAADVYAVGALAWWCVTGAPPGPAALRPPLAEVAPGVAPAWRELTEQALAGDPRDRPGAAELALGYFDSAPCEPLRMTVGADETSLLTQRIRGSAAAEPQTLADPGPRRGPRRRPWWLAAALAAAALVVTGGVVLGLAGVVRPPWVDAREGRSPVPAAGSVPATSRAGLAGTSGTPARRDPATDRRAPSRDLAGLVQSLADARAAAVTSGDVAALGRLDVPGSEAWRQDEATLVALRKRGERYAGVRFTVASTRLVAVSADRATVDAAVDTAAYRVVATGTRRDRPAARGPVLRLGLAWVGGRWLVESVRDPGTRS